MYIGVVELRLVRLSFGWPPQPERVVGVLFCPKRRRPPCGRGPLAGAAARCGCRGNRVCRVLYAGESGFALWRLCDGLEEVVDSLGDLVEDLVVLGEILGGVL